jgi:hypothetical protein
LLRAAAAVTVVYLLFTKSATERADLKVSEKLFFDFYCTIDIHLPLTFRH